MISKTLTLLFFLSNALTLVFSLATQVQLDYQNAEIGALMCFSSNTYGELQGCDANNWHLVGNSNVFQPTELDVDSWLEAAAGFGAKYAVLTAKHQCGFCLWPTNATIPIEPPIRYNYSVAFSTWKDGKEDVIKKFFESCKKYGIRPGIYYSLNSNEFLRINAGNKSSYPKLEGQIDIEIDKYHDMVVEQLEELINLYVDDQDKASIPLEIWFDGGYSEQAKERVSNILKKYLPNTCAFNGFGISDNPVRWAGTESGYAQDPNWSTGPENGGDPNSPYFVPTEVDFTLQNDDNWFYIKNYPIHTVEELVDVYHKSVGLNANMILDLAIPPNGKIDANHMARYKEFGNYITKCYGTAPLASTTVSSGNEIVIEFETLSLVDRVTFGEDQTNGNFIKNFEVSFFDGNNWSSIRKGESVGHKRVVIFQNELKATKLKLTYDVIQKVYLEARNCLNKNQKIEEIKFME